MNGGKLGGVEATRRIRRSFPSVSVILVTDTDDEEHLFSAVKCGASAYLTKGIDPVDLVNLIRIVAQGAQPISEALLRPGIASRVIAEFEVFASIGEQVEDLFARLSPVEADILRRIADGGSSEQVAQALGITKEEVEHNLGLILSKLIANDHNLEIIETTQKRGSVPLRIPTAIT
ncbi:Transcriptional regulatory protein DegU [subsurface metagenome]